MGCGHGLLGILSKIQGASLVTLQDYNQEVLEKVTIPTISANHLDATQFMVLSGDWGALKSNNQKYELLLGSELIYS